mmetsp:Transcript_17122/g.66677  ORF Transcript_17122/g.66677 Transcript_17122/m.66677 type:complete len:255 (-) Transcript_17122:354-1118(-)
MGSLYLQKNTFISYWRMLGLFWRIRLMLRRATYWISGSLESSVTRGAAILRLSVRMTSCDWMWSMKLISSLIAPSTTAELECCRREVTRSAMLSASRESLGSYVETAFRITVCPHSVHSLRAASSLFRMIGVNWKTSPLHASLISHSAARELETTIGFESPSRAMRISTKPCWRTGSGEMSKIFATQIAAVLRTYGSASFRHCLRGMYRYSTICSILMQPIVRIARARMSGFGLAASFTNWLTARMASVGWLLA